MLNLNKLVKIYQFKCSANKLFTTTQLKKMSIQGIISRNHLFFSVYKKSIVLSQDSDFLCSTAPHFTKIAHGGCLTGCFERLTLN